MVPVRDDDPTSPNRITGICWAKANLGTISLIQFFFEFLASKFYTPSPQSLRMVLGRDIEAMFPVYVGVNER
jgi:hypothetical protein